VLYRRVDVHKKMLALVVADVATSERLRHPAERRDDRGRAGGADDGDGVGDVAARSAAETYTDNPVSSAFVSLRVGCLEGLRQPDACQ
jgi:hypothetical protein